MGRSHTIMLCKSQVYRSSRAASPMKTSVWRGAAKQPGSQAKSRLNDHFIPRRQLRPHLQELHQLRLHALQPESIFDYLIPSIIRRPALPIPQSPLRFPGQATAKQLRPHLELHYHLPHTSLSSTMSATLPAKLRSPRISPFAKRASELEKFKPIIAYWRMFAASPRTSSLDILTKLSPILHCRTDYCAGPPHSR
jgi:hypothetical protein